MSDTTTYQPRVSHYAAQEAASDWAAAAAQDAHDVVAMPHDLDLSLRGIRLNRCRCGREFRTSRALGLHRGAVRRQADKAWDAAYEQAHDEAMARAGY